MHLDVYESIWLKLGLVIDTIKYLSQDLASACNSYSCPMSRGYACALVTVVRALAHYFHVFSFAQLKLFFILLKLTRSQSS